MDTRQQAITEYLNKGTTFRDLAAKYGVSRTTINKWVQIHQGIHNIAPTPNQQKYYLTGMNSKPDHLSSADFKKQKELEQKIALLEKQLAWEKLRADTLDTMINIAEKQLEISIRKKSGSQQSKK
jgi:transposase-like protein